MLILGGIYKAFDLKLTGDDMKKQNQKEQLGDMRQSKDREEMNDSLLGLFHNWIGINKAGMTEQNIKERFKGRDIKSIVDDFLGDIKSILVSDLLCPKCGKNVIAMESVNLDYPKGICGDCYSMENI